MKMWDGRFQRPTDRLMERFNNSLPVDREMFAEDLSVNAAWAAALGRAGVLSQADVRKLTAALARMRKDHTNGRIDFADADEDVHMAVERILTARAGDAGRRIHTGRSRNDQVATDFRLFVMKSLGAIAGDVAGLQRALVGRAERDVAVIAPGYTHLQQAQPVLLAHYWLSMFWALEREKTRLAHARAPADVMPLGSGAIAGCGFAVDREFLARELGFSRISENSMDAVASRDFALEALSAIASLGVLCSRYAEDLIIWSSREFGFVELDDAWSTGSSMMPQKKNPDSLELVRGKTGRFLGNYQRLATTLKGVGLTYYKDLQEDKEPVFDSIAQIRLVVTVLAQVIRTLRVSRDRIERARDPFLFATDLADYLVVRGMPFRQAHKVVGEIVAHCITASRPIDKMTVGDLRKFSDRFGSDAVRVFDWDRAIQHRDIPGGTGRGSVRRQLARARRAMREEEARGQRSAVSRKRRGKQGG